MAHKSSKLVNDDSQQLYNYLEQLKDRHGLDFMFQAVKAILEDYFKLGSDQTANGQSLTQAVEDLRCEVASLKMQVSKLQQNSKRDRTNQLTDVNQSELLNQKQLAQRLGVDDSVVEQHKTDGKEFIEWSRSKDPNRIAWKYTEAGLFRQI